MVTLEHLFGRSYLNSIGNANPTDEAVQLIVDCIENREKLDYLDPFKKKFERWCTGVFLAECDVCGKEGDCVLVTYGATDPPDDETEYTVQCKDGHR